jgi:hypothetical protein
MNSQGPEVVMLVTFLVLIKVLMVMTGNSVVDNLNAYGVPKKSWKIGIVMIGAVVSVICFLEGKIMTRMMISVCAQNVWSQRT